MAVTVRSCNFCSKAEAGAASVALPHPRWRGRGQAPRLPMAVRAARAVFPNAPCAAHL